MCRSVKVNANQKSVQIKAEIHVLHRTASHHGHGTALVLTGIAARADPFKKCLPSVDFDIEKSAREGMDRTLTAPADGPGQFRWRGVSQYQIYILQMLAEQVVEHIVLGARMIVAEPPIPVTALGDINLLPGLANAVGVGVFARSALAEMFPSAVQGVPGRVILLVTNPGGEIVIDPASGKELWQCVAGRIALQISCDTKSVNVLGTRAALVEGAEKSDTPAGIMLPAIFAVENDTHQRRLGVVDSLTDATQACDKILRRLRRLAPLVVEADHVAQSVISEDDPQLGPSFRYFVGTIHTVRIA